VTRGPMDFRINMLMGHQRRLTWEPLLVWPLSQRINYTENRRAGQHSICANKRNAGN
jgi:hypothetical protein